jgi:hypothetical protein
MRADVIDQKAAEGVMMTLILLRRDCAAGSLIMTHIPAIITGKA